MSKRKNSNKCKCGNPGSEPHPCPYSIEMSIGEPDEDKAKEELCNCCPECTLKCRDAI